METPSAANYLTQKLRAQTKLRSANQMRDSLANHNSAFAAVNQKNVNKCK